jgi:hypothetical protein
MDTDSLFRELKPDVEQLADPLFQASCKFVKARGMFLPHGAVLTVGDEVRLVMAVPPGEDRPVSTIEILPLLHNALRQAAEPEQLRAVAVCEDVRITPAGKNQTPAIKVLVEHRRGLCVALYMPFRKRLFLGYRFDEIFVQPANPEVSPWGSLVAV